MGRTQPTSTLKLETLRIEWSYFVEVTSRQDQQDFAWLWQAAERRRNAIGNVARPTPMEAVFMAMLVELAARNRRLEARIARVERLTGLDDDSKIGEGIPS